VVTRLYVGELQVAAEAVVVLRFMVPMPRTWADSPLWLKKSEKLV
jgi:hypothetical protein